MKTRDFKPEDNMLRIPISAMEDIWKQGYAYITIPDGRCVRITKDDILFKKEEIDELERKLKSGEVKL